jgi:hypothetical protein
MLPPQWGKSPLNIDPVGGRGGAEAHMRGRKKVGGTGTNARSREIDEDGECEEINSESSGSNGAPGLRAGDSGLVLGRLAWCHSVILPLGEQDREPKSHCCGVDHTFIASRWLLGASAASTVDTLAFEKTSRRTRVRTEASPPHPFASDNSEGECSRRRPPASPGVALGNRPRVETAVCLRLPYRSRRDRLTSARGFPKSRSPYGLLWPARRVAKRSSSPRGGSPMPARGSRGKPGRAALSSVPSAAQDGRGAATRGTAYPYERPS